MRPDYCEACGVYLASDLPRDPDYPELCIECGVDEYGDVDGPRQTLCNGTCDTCDCEIWVRQSGAL